MSIVCNIFMFINYKEQNVFIIAKMKKKDILLQYCIYLYCN